MSAAPGPPRPYPTSPRNKCITAPENPRGSRCDARHLQRALVQYVVRKRPRKMIVLVPSVVVVGQISYCDHDRTASIGRAPVTVMCRKTRASTRPSVPGWAMRRAPCPACLHQTHAGHGPECLQPGAAHHGHRTAAGADATSDRPAAQPPRRSCTATFRPARPCAYSSRSLLSSVRIRYICRRAYSQIAHERPSVPAALMKEYHQYKKRHLNSG